MRKKGGFVRISRLQERDLSQRLGAAREVEEVHIREGLLMEELVMEDRAIALREESGIKGYASGN